MLVGDNVLFWKDLWLDEILTDTHPRAFSYARNEDCSVKDFLTINSLEEQFYLPLSSQALEEVQDMQGLMAQITFDNSQNAKDVWSYTWGSREFSAKKYYNFYFRDMRAHKTYQWLWKSKVTTKIKVFGWLVLSDRLNTRNMLKRRHYNIGTNLSCLLYGQKEEDIDHMILTCPFSRSCWATFGLDPGPQANRLSWMEQAKIS